MAFNPDKCLKFKALANNCNIALNGYQFSKNGTSWQNNSITLNQGETCFVKGTVFPGAEGVYNCFTISADAEIISGNVMSLVDDGAGALNEVKTYGFRGLFYNCAKLKSIHSELLPATSLAPYCYDSLFNGCSGLTSVPEGLLPATELAIYCYGSMFRLCTHITTIPSGLLPAVTVVESAYQFMFGGCQALTVVPFGFFPAGITLAGQKACQDMFYNCTALNEVHVPFTSWTYNTTNTWLKDVASSGDFYCPVQLEDLRGADYIPRNWNRHHERPVPPGFSKSVSVVYLGNITVAGAF